MTPDDVSQLERADILGILVSCIKMDDAIATMERWIAERRHNYVCVRDAHGIIRSRHNERLRAVHNEAGMVTPDGVPIVWFLRLSGKRHVSRVYGPDLMREMTAVSSRRGYRQFYYGGVDGVSEKLKQVLKEAHPGLEVVGTLCPPFRQLTPEEDQEVVDAINAARPDIVWVGLGTPKQEIWMADHLGRIEAPVMIGVGAAFDFLAGTKRQAPLWMQRTGMEWIFRLCTEPRRLWRRYAYVVPRFAFLAAGELLRRRFRASEDFLWDASARK